MLHQFRVLLLILTAFTFSSTAQLFYGQDEFVWPDNNTNYKPTPDSLKNNDAVILKENLIINESNLSRRVAVLLLNTNGCKAFQKITLPENFDIGNYPNFNRQGRFKDRKVPYIYSYLIQHFHARIIRNKKIINIPLKYETQKTYWLKTDGERLYDNVVEVQIGNCLPGDILEYTYLVDNIDWCRTQDIIFPNGVYPKLNYTLQVNATSYVPAKTQLIYNSNINNNDLKSERSQNGNFKTERNLYIYAYLRGIAYPRHCHPGVTLPNISVNHRYCTGNIPISRFAYFNRYGTFLKSMNIAQFDAGAPYYSNYYWALITDTLRQYIYDSYTTGIHKFLKRFPDQPNDSCGFLFANSLVDSLNQFDFLLAEIWRNSGKAQYAVPSSHYLEKGSVCEEFYVKNFEDLLAEKRIFYYQGIIIDKRFGAINPAFRSHSRMESKLLVIPEKNSFHVYVPRYRGLSYFPDELPFYYEQTPCMLLPCYNCEGNARVKKLQEMVTAGSTASDNERIESILVKVDTDSLKMHLSIKESLAGQFSTVLRHYYDSQPIDSTIDEYYFKKCTDKPGALSKQIKRGSCAKAFPFRAHYLADESMKLLSGKKIPLHNWFSFILPKEVFSIEPDHDFYFDFACSDQYHFMFEFNHPVEVINLEDLKADIDNDHFELKCSLEKLEDTKYLLNVSCKIKTESIPRSESRKFVEFVNKLDEVNNFEIRLK